MGTLKKRLFVLVPGIVVLALMSLLILGTPAYAASHTGVAVSTHVHTTSHTHITRPIPNINQVNCGNRSDFFTIYSQANGNYYQACYANRGTTYPNISGVYYVCSGNNSGQILYYDYNAGRSGSENFPHNQCTQYVNIYIGTLTIF